MFRKLNVFGALENLHSHCAQILWNLTHQVRPLFNARLATNFRASTQA